MYGVPMIDMAPLPDLESFESSGGNAEKIWTRHGVAPLEAEQALFNTPLLWGDDPGHSGAEKEAHI